MSDGERMLESLAHCVVQLRAYELWEERERRLWEDVKDWLDAEREFEAQKKSSQNRRALFIKWRAKELWLLYLRPVDRDDELWRQAEHDVDEDREASIARVAYRKWKDAGCPAGTAKKDWTDAQSEVAARLF